MRVHTSKQKKKLYFEHLNGNTILIHSILHVIILLDNKLIHINSQIKRIKVIIKIYLENK